MNVPAYTLLPHYRRSYVETETLRYNNGTEVISRTKERIMEQSRAICITHLPTNKRGRVEFWMDHDPRIVAVSYTYRLI